MMITDYTGYNPTVVFTGVLKVIIHIRGHEYIYPCFYGRLTIN